MFGNFRLTDFNCGWKIITGHESLVTSFCGVLLSVLVNNMQSFCTAKTSAICGEVAVFEI